MDRYDELLDFILFVAEEYNPLVSIEKGNLYVTTETPMDEKTVDGIDVFLVDYPEIQNLYYGVI